MNVIPYGCQWIDKNDIQEIVKVLGSDWLTQGPTVKKFEQALCEYTGAKYAVSVSSGTAALHIACLAAEIKNGDEVITSPITFVASPNSVLYCSGKPIFADVKKDTVNIDPAEIKKKLTKKTKAIIPVHFAGHPCDLEEINFIAKEYSENIVIIEDAAHALGAQYKGSRIGACKYSNMTIFSFHPVKSITTGEGGAVLTNRKDIYEKLLLLRSHGITKDPKKFCNFDSSIDESGYYEMQVIGFNYRITDFQSALGISQLKKIDKFIKRRRDIVNIYNNELFKINSIFLPIEKPYVKSSWHIYYIRLRNSAKRRSIFKKLQEYNIGVQVHYIPVHLQPYYKRNFNYKEGDYPNAEDYYRRTITLPLYPKIKDTDIEYVLSVLRKVL